MHGIQHEMLGGFTFQRFATTDQQAKVRAALEQAEEVIGGQMRIIQAQQTALGGLVQ